MFESNKEWFQFTSKKEEFRVYAFSGKEEVHKPYEFNIELIHTSKDLDLTELLGTSATLEIADKSGTTRFVNGIIAKMKQLHTNNDFTHYSCLLVPRLWFLEKTQDHRIFQNMSVVDIIQELLREQGFTEDSIAFKLANTYEAREYCVQYSESILYFISRLCEEEGIYFYFEHEQDKHILCFCDKDGGPFIDGESTLIYDPISGTTVDTAIIHKITLDHEINIHASEFREWDFTKPTMDLKVQKSENEHNLAPQLGNAKLEEYKYPHLYTAPRPDGEKYVNIEHLRHLVYREWIEVEASVSRFLPSYVYAIIPNLLLNKSITDKKWWVVSTVHEGKQPAVLEHLASGAEGFEYRTKVISIPNTTRFIPSLEHPKKRIDALQTAVVTGPENEEIFTDEYGRVKVKFHWDRLGKDDESSSLWLRVSQAWSGNSFGSVHIPRIGQEVLVSFLEGNPDRPMVTGRVDNADNMPPWKLPEERFLSGIQSREIKSNTRNQLVMDDTQGRIQTQLSSDYECSQLNLGAIRRIEHRRGRTDVRGEGFELRTDAWGSVRAARGVYITADKKEKAEDIQMNLDEAKLRLEKAIEYHSEMLELAKKQLALDASASSETTKGLENQITEIEASTKQNATTVNPYLLLSSPSGIVSVTDNTTHMYSGSDTALTAVDNISLATGKNIQMSALESVNVFSYGTGINLISAKEDIDIQAQSTNITALAKNEINIASTESSINLVASKEITLNVGGSFISITPSGIEMGTSGIAKIQAASHDLSGSQTKSPKNYTLQSVAPPPSIEELVGYAPLIVEEVQEKIKNITYYDDTYVLVDKDTRERLANWECEVIVDDGEPEIIVTNEEGFIKYLKADHKQKIVIRPIGPVENEKNEEKKNDKW